MEKFKFDFDKDWGEQLKKAHDEKLEISKEDVQEIVCNRLLCISLGSGRWTESKVALFACDEFYYGLSFDEGLTEYQENEYEAQVPEKYERVEVKTYDYKEVK